MILDKQIPKQILALTYLTHPIKPKNDRDLISLVKVFVPDFLDYLTSARKDFVNYPHYSNLTRLTTFQEMSERLVNTNRFEFVSQSYTWLTIDSSVFALLQHTMPFFLLKSDSWIKLC